MICFSQSTPLNQRRTVKRCVLIPSQQRDKSPLSLQTRVKFFNDIHQHHLEVGRGWGHDNSRTQPADILVTNWDCGTSAAFDIMVAYLLNSHNNLEAGMYQGVSATAAEHRKHNKNDPKCAELGWRCVPLAVENCEAWGPEAFSQVGLRLAICSNTPCPRW